MNVYISGQDKAVLAAVAKFLEEQTQVKVYDMEVKPDGTMKAGVGCEVDFLDALLEQFPQVDISAYEISDVEGRDSSWWSTTKYASKADKDGKKTMYCTGSSTGWV